MTKTEIGQVKGLVADVHEALSEKGQKAFEKGQKGAFDLAVRAIEIK